MVTTFTTFTKYPDIFTKFTPMNIYKYVDKNRTRTNCVKNGIAYAFYFYTYYFLYYVDLSKLTF